MWKVVKIILSIIAVVALVLAIQQSLVLSDISKALKNIEKDPSYRAVPTPIKNEIQNIQQATGSTVVFNIFER